MQTDKQPDKHVDVHRQTDIQADRDRHRYRQDIVIQSDRKKDRHAYKPHKHTRQTDRQTDKQADKHLDIHRQTWLLYGLQDGEKMMDFLKPFTLDIMRDNRFSKLNVHKDAGYDVTP